MKVQGKVHLVPNRDCTGVYKYSYTLSLTSALDLGYMVNATPRPFYTWERTPVLLAVKLEQL